MADAPIELTKPVAEQAPVASQNQSLRDCVEQAMDNYFKHLEGQSVQDVYDLVMAEVEAPMLEIVMKYTRHNQTRAAQVLGLNRGTLRKKLKQYGLL
ncbi:DNA-binding transcriptional regulator Fis [Pseudomaricurvus alcaniphilus]|uniref:DNA-binding transcriptional regulator Fis n=1 Tax=Pseudomaricurvus alcaniphilus TaxID=1166482 RepID=UPI001FB6DBF2|nr:DNA-binding transcriptional regulator Fis [Pseudomaricurvus alcaniphilus]